MYDKRPANVLIAKAVEICESRGVSYLIYGKFKYGNKSQSSLLEFKLRNGFEEFLVPRYYVPLTTRGSVCLRFNLHRGLIGILPPRLINAGLNLRSMWNNVVGSKAGVAQCQSGRIVFGRRSVQILPPAPTKLRKHDRVSPICTHGHSPMEGPTETAVT